MNFPYDGNVATLSPDVRHNAKQIEKELIGAFVLLVQRGSELDTAVSVRLWMGRSSNASVVYATAWIFDPENRDVRGGHGKAGGYGYDKRSAAIEAAFDSAGVTFERSFGGAGESASRAAILAVARAAGWPVDTNPHAIVEV